MSTRAYPGKGLSLSQLVFALNEELKHVAYSPSFTSDEVSQLDQGASTAFATIRGWMNSFVHINRVPSDILSLIPTHLSSQEDRFRASFVCRRWRRIFLQHAALWSQLFLSKGEVYVKTLLERAKGSPLDIFASHADPASTIALLTPHTKQIKHLDFVYDHWEDIQKFSEDNSGPFPLLRTLAINAAKEIDLEDPDEMIPSSLPLFSNAPNLMEFRLHSERPPFLSHFVLPRLTVFELSTGSVEDMFHASQLLNFLEASPMLRTVRMRITGRISFEGVTEERLVVLPSLEFLYLVTSDGDSGYEIAAQVSCPSAKYTSLMHEKLVDEDDDIILETFPGQVSWNAILRQYTKNPVEEVTLKIKIGPEPTTASCSLTFQSPDAVAIRLGFKLTENDDGEGLARLQIPESAEMYSELFSSASRIIQGHPLLADVKRLHIYVSTPALHSDQIADIADEVRPLFQSLGPLEELTMHCRDLRPYLTPPKSRGILKPVVFPPVRELTISHPLYPPRGECTTAIVGLAKSQHTQGVPFERVTIRMEEPPAAMVKKLSPWVGAAYCYNERYVAIGDDDQSPI